MDAANTLEVDTAFKPPDVLFSRFLRSIAHDHILEVWISLSLHDMSYDGVKPIDNLVNKIIVGCFIRFHVLYEVCIKISII